MATTKSQIAKRSSDSYMELIRRFPLKTIKTDQEHEQATAMISQLMGHDLDTGSGDYLDALIVLVNKYEDERHAIDERMTPREALRALMEANRLSQADVGRVIGSESAGAMVFEGGWGVSNGHVRKIGGPV